MTGPQHFPSRVTRILRSIIWAATFAGIATLAAPSMAEMIVIDSNAPAYTSGMKLADDAAFDLKKGTTLKLLKQPAGTTHVLKGPYRGMLHDYAGRPGSLWDKMFGSKDTTRSTAPPVGGTRGTKQPPPTGGTRGIR